MNNEVEKKPKKKKLKKIIVILVILFVIGLSSFVFLLYGPYNKFRNFLITTAMGTMNHQYLATIFYNDKTIEKVLNQNYVKESGDSTDTSQVVFTDHETSNNIF